jgi:hypothetical protein
MALRIVPNVTPSALAVSDGNAGASNPLSALGFFAELLDAQAATPEPVQGTNTPKVALDTSSSSGTQDSKDEQNLPIDPSLAMGTAANFASQALASFMLHAGAEGKGVISQDLSIQGAVSAARPSVADMGGNAMLSSSGTSSSTQNLPAGAALQAAQQAALNATPSMAAQDVVGQETGSALPNDSVDLISESNQNVESNRVLIQNPAISPSNGGDQPADKALNASNLSLASQAKPNDTASTANLSNLQYTDQSQVLTSSMQANECIETMSSAVSQNPVMVPLAVSSLPSIAQTQWPAMPNSTTQAEQSSRLSINSHAFDLGGQQAEQLIELTSGHSFVASVSNSQTPRDPEIQDSSSLNRSAGAQIGATTSTASTTSSSDAVQDLPTSPTQTPEWRDAMAASADSSVSMAVAQTADPHLQSKPNASPLISGVSDEGQSNSELHAGPVVQMASIQTANVNSAGPSSNDQGLKVKAPAVQAFELQKPKFEQANKANSDSTSTASLDTSLNAGKHPVLSDISANSVVTSTSNSDARSFETQGALKLPAHMVRLDTPEVAGKIQNLAKSGGGELRIDVTPPDEKSFKITLSVKDAQDVRLIVSGASDATRNRLDQSADQLRQQFFQMGMNLSLNFEQSGFRNSQAYAQQPSNENPSMQSNTKPTLDGLAGDASLSKAQPNSMINLYA